LGKLALRIWTAMLGEIFYFRELCGYGLRAESPRSLRLLRRAIPYHKRRAATTTTKIRRFSFAVCEFDRSN